MAKLDPEKLSVKFETGVNQTDPVIPRRYTLTHSDMTGELFLTVGQEYDYKKFSPMRDEVLAEWRTTSQQYLLYVYVDIDGQLGKQKTADRYKILKRELPLALEAIRYGDDEFFKAHSKLDNMPIVVNFMSSNSSYNKVEKFGTPSKFRIQEKTPEEADIDKSVNRTSKEDKDINSSRDKKDNKNYKDNKDNVIITLLIPYIEKEIFKLYGRYKRFRLKDVEVISIDETNIEESSKINYEVTIGLKIGEDASLNNNLIIQFRITSNSVNTIKVDTQG